MPRGRREKTVAPPVGNDVEKPKEIQISIFLICPCVVLGHLVGTGPPLDVDDVLIVVRCHSCTIPCSYRIGSCAFSLSVSHAKSHSFQYDAKMRCTPISVGVEFRNNHGVDVAALILRGNLCFVGVGISLAVAVSTRLHNEQKPCQGLNHTSTTQPVHDIYIQYQLLIVLRLLLLRFDRSEMLMAWLTVLLAFLPP